jgi:uncharacterized membrane protein YphA (DoxX/SURF4 family)
MEESPMSHETIATANPRLDLMPAVARVLLSVPFVWAGYLKIVAPATYESYFAHLGLPLPVVAHTDFSNPDMRIHFMKNVVMAGGFLYVAAFGAGGHYTIQQALAGRRRAIR